MLRTLLSPGGRVGRMEFWLVSFVIWVAATLMALLPAYVSWIFLLPLSWMQLTLSARRFHDFGFSGWNVVWHWAATIGLYLSLAFLAYHATAQAGLLKIAGTGIAFLVSAAVWLVLSLLACFRPGADGANEYGTPQCGSLAST